MKYLQKFYESTGRFDEWIKTDVQDMIDRMDISCGNANIGMSFRKEKQTDDWPDSYKKPGWTLMFWFEDPTADDGEMEPILLTQNQCDVISGIINYMADHGYPIQILTIGEDYGDSSDVDSLKHLFDFEYDIGLFGKIVFYGRVI